MLIYLVGFMGSGKSYYGKKWAAETNMYFYDLDTLIEQQQALSIAEIFAQKGTAYFRDIEAAVLQTTGNFTNSIVACGGGTPCYHNNMAYMRYHGKVIFLNVSMPTILNNLKNQTNQRPLLHPLADADRLAYVQHTLAERMPYYLKSSITLTSEQLADEAFSFTTLKNNIKR